jgi:hypothetical protein
MAQNTVWGPSENMLHNAIIHKFNGSWVQQDQHDVDDDIALLGKDEGFLAGDDDVLEAVESVTFMEAYHQDDNSDGECGDTNIELPSLPVKWFWIGMAVVVPDVEIDVPHVDEVTIDEFDNGVDPVHRIRSSRLGSPATS